VSYSSNGSRPKLSEKGLLTPDNCVVALIDHQPQMLFGTSNFDRQKVINNTVALAKASRVFGVPVVLTTVETKSFSGNMWPQLRAVFPGQEPIERSSMNSWDDKNFVAAIQKTILGRILSVHSIPCFQRGTILVSWPPPVLAPLISSTHIPALRWHCHTV
jgi:Isochorismatase family